MDRLQQALIYMETHLSEALTVEQVAGQVGLSPYHFCRYFRRVKGETVMGYLRRRRLDYAANRLRLEPIRLLDLALESGFQSQQSFHRAFKKAFGVTPGLYRRTDGWTARPSPCKIPKPGETDPMNTPDEPRIESRPASRLVGLSMTIARGGQQEIPGLWRRFRTVYPEIPGKDETAFYGLCYDQDRRDGRFTYLAALAVETKDAVAEELTALDLPAGLYAVFTHKIDDCDLSKDIPNTFRYIFGSWLPASDYEIGDGPDFELYDERFDSATMSGEIDLYIPIKAKSKAAQ